MNSKEKTRAIIDQVVEKAQQTHVGKAIVALERFIRLFYGNLSLEDLQAYSVENLYGLACCQWQLMRSRVVGIPKLRVYNPSLEKDGWSSSHTIIELCTDDMPFLIDSMHMEITRLGLTIHQMIFAGGIQCLRAEGEIADIQPFSHPLEGGSAEAPIHLEIDRQNDTAALQKIEEDLLRVLADVRMVVEDWPKMMGCVESIIEEYAEPELQQQFPDMKESRAFLEWLLNHHFTFLGYRDYVVSGEGDQRALELVKGSGLGVLRDSTTSRHRREYADLPQEAREVALSLDQCLIITKTNTRSTVHRPTYTDYIGIKRFDKQGRLVGERRVIGLYTSSAYSSDPQAIPFLRHKVKEVMQISELSGRSHAGKDLLHILSTFPRDDLLHAPVKEVYEIAMGIMRLQERRRIRMFARKDIYGRFVSVLVFVPRENFNTVLVERMRSILAEEMQADEVLMNTRFSESVLARIHYVVRLNSTEPRKYDFESIEKRLVAAGQSWQEGLLENLMAFYGEESANELQGLYRRAFPAGYREHFLARNAVFDIEKIEKLRRGSPMEMVCYRTKDCSELEVKLKLFHPCSYVPLSDAVPMLENMGFRVLHEDSYRVAVKDEVFWINDFKLSYCQSSLCDIDEFDEYFYSAFKKIWAGDAENDGFNKLVVAANMSWREVSLLRAYAKYFRQIGFSLSQQYIEEALVANALIATDLVRLFDQRFNPVEHDHSDEAQAAISENILAALDQVASLDQDRILRMYLKTVMATLRTNYYQKNESGEPKTYLSLKLNSAGVPDMPLPRPAFEVFVYSPRFEGVHLRSANVARGGIRWSDRKEDFRVEVLGLMKAQQVKNALIVPAGAKGGFVTKRLTAEMSREAMMAEGVSCYQDYIRSLLDVTDNIVGPEIVAPNDTVAYDEQDPYLVVAADKGTATFSDIANAISAEYGFWLGDAFASGGSAGYDHKKMGITARGAWVSAKRHFLELGLDVDKDEVTVIGIGDMSGDVFGNGVLLSPHLKLVAAYNHQHIFLDPTPNPEVSYRERQRLFALPRSTWDDYDRNLLSAGGGVYKRSAKAIRLTPEVKAMLGLEQDVIVPNELINLLLKSPVDMIWNGGIGTFVKASTEKNSEVGDRANDPIRVNGYELRAKVVCEGGNLGLTQLGRIEYELSGGKVNTDFIDNSAGVDCSDHEVNIKILLNGLLQNQALTLDERNALLVEMTDTVAHLVLKNNYHQNQALSLAAIKSVGRLGLYIDFIDDLERRGLLNRELEFLPDNLALLERKSEGIGLTRPELAVLLSYSKITLKNAMLASDIPEDAYLSSYARFAFPKVLRERYPDLIAKHRLSRELIATQLSNQVVSDMGATFIYQVSDETGADLASILRAYVASKEIFNVESVQQAIEALDYQVSADVQYEMILDGIQLVRRSTRWMLRNRKDGLDIEALVSQFKPAIVGLYRRLPKFLRGQVRDKLYAKTHEFIEAGVPESLAMQVASASAIYHTLNVVECASSCDIEFYQVAKIYFMLVDRLELPVLRNCINAYPIDSRWSVLARAAFKADLDWAQRRIAANVLQFSTASDSLSQRLDAWFESNQVMVHRVRQVIADIRSTDAPDFAILSVALRELMDLAEVGRTVSL